MSRHSTPPGRMDRLPVQIDQTTYTKRLLYRGRVPGLAVEDGSGEVVFHVGPQYQDAMTARQWAFALARTAMDFMEMCDRMTACPTHEPDSGGER